MKDGEQMHLWTQGRIQGLSLGRAIYEGKGGLENFRRHALQSLTERGQRPFSTKNVIRRFTHSQNTRKLKNFITETNIQAK